MVSKICLQACVCFVILSTISASFYSTLLRRRFPVFERKTCLERNEEAQALGRTLYGGKLCSQSTQCAWQLCPRNSEADCVILCNSCTCPEGTSCQREMTVHSGVYGPIRTKSEYRCL